MGVVYVWSRQNGTNVPPNRFMSIEPNEGYYKGMPLKLKEKGIVEPTDGDPEYICMAEYNPGAEIQPLEIPVQEVFPDVVYDRMNDDGSIEEVRFGSKGGGADVLNENGKLKSEVLPEGYPYDAGSFIYTNSGYKPGDELVDRHWFKVSDDTPSYEDLLGAKFITDDEPEGELTSDNTTYVEGEATFAQIGTNRKILVTYKDNFDASGDGSVIIPTKGVYMNVIYYITISKNRITTIDSEFLPKITIIQDGYDDAAMGVAAAGVSAYTCTANVTFEELLQALQNKNVPMVELYYHGHGDGVIGVAKGGTTYLRVDTGGNIEIYQEFYINGGHLLVVWKANGKIELSPNI